MADNQLSTAGLAVIAAAGGIGALISGLVTAWVQARNDRRLERRERENWLRIERLRTYTDLMGSVNYTIQVKWHTPDSTENRLDAMKRMAYAIGPALSLADEDSEPLMQQLWSDTETYLNSPSEEVMARLKSGSAQLRRKIAQSAGVAKGSTGNGGS